MLGFRFARLSLYPLALVGILSAQAPAKVDFAKDVQPILRQNCVGCHGAAQQSSGFRLDRKSEVIGRRGVLPGNVENSLLFFRITGTQYGMQMPPTGPLKPEQIKTIKTWIEQGADWPDALANEVALPPLNPKAVALVETLRTGDVAGFMKSVTAEPKLLNARGPDGSTPFMYSVLYTGKATLEQLLKLGADPNKKNDGNATALMWAASDLEKTTLLVNHGADVNARSSDMRTPLMIAARKQGNLTTVKFLLDHKANPNPNAHPGAEGSPLTEAVNAADPASVEMLLNSGADAKAVGQQVLELSALMRCPKCLALVIAKNLDKESYSMALPNVMMSGDVNAVKAMVDHGADVNAVDPLGRTPLMYAAGSDLLDLDVVKLLVERGADVNTKDSHKQGGDSGLSVLDIAKLHGDTPVVQYLMKAGAKSSAHAAPILKARRENTIPKAIAGSIPLIQKADANFIPKAACASCHNNSLAAMAVASARGHGVKVDEKIAEQQLGANVFGLEKLRGVLYQDSFGQVGDFFAPFVLSYMLIGMEAEHYKPDLSTDAVAMFLKSRQSLDGEWMYVAADPRPPICSDYIGQTVISMRALQLYAPKVDKAGYDDSIRRAAAWIAVAKSRNNEDRTWRVLGLAWWGKDKEATQKAMKELLATQRADGGWSDLESMESSVYSTGKSLFALQTAGLSSSDAAYQRAVKFLLSTQQEDGSWYVKTRALALQPYFDAGFPHGFDQWISAMGSSWAALALSGASTPAAPSRTTGGAGAR